MLRNRTKALATRWARHGSKDSRPLLWSGILAANGLVFLALSALPAVSSPVLAMVAFYMLGLATCLFERAGFIELLRETGTGEKEGNEPGGSSDRWGSTISPDSR